MDIRRPAFRIRQQRFATLSVSWPHQGKFCVGSWPEGQVANFKGGEAGKKSVAWRRRHRDRMACLCTTASCMAVRSRDPRSVGMMADPNWTSLKRFYSPDGWEPGIPYHCNRKEVNEWVRLTSLTDPRRTAICQHRQLYELRHRCTGRRPRHSLQYGSRQSEPPTTMTWAPAGSTWWP